jgi:hypothetical protein
MKRRVQFLLAVMLASINGFAQQPANAFDFRAVVQPGMTIGGHTFTSKTTVSNAAINDAGEVAFVANYFDGTPERSSILTSRRLIVKEGDAVDAKFIVLIPPDSAVKINNAGQVAYGAWYADTQEIARGHEASGFGIFVERHLFSTVDINSLGRIPMFTLTDDGQIIIGNANPSADAKPKPSVFDRLRIKQPNGFPISIAPTSQPPSAPQVAKQYPAERPMPFPTNHRGQILIPVNFTEGGFLLILGTPVTH